MMMEAFYWGYIMGVGTVVFAVFGGVIASWVSGWRDRRNRNRGR